MGLAAVTAADPRTKSQIQQAAHECLLHHAAQGRFKAPAQLQEIEAGQGYAIYGAAEAGFAVVSADDMLPAVLAYSDAPLTDEVRTQSGLSWWLEHVADVAVQAVAMGRREVNVPIDTTRFPKAVAPMLTTRWDQERPYYNMCPMEGTSRCMTGCVATAMAQVLRYWRYPERTTGTVITNSTSGSSVSVDFDGLEFDWDGMLDTYSYVTGYGTRQANAVAQLMVACGVSVNMNYRRDGSGASATFIPTALTRNFGFYPTVTYASRNAYGDNDWMELIYADLSKGQPVIYGGVDTRSLGHCFVFDGYDEDGLVHVNWGWSGQADGYYNIDMLNPLYYRFNDQQELIYNINPMNRELGDDDILEHTYTVTAPGTLAQVVGDEYYKGNAAKFVGPISEEDFSFIRKMAGIDPQGRTTLGRLARIDLSEATLVGDSLPRMALAECPFLQEVVLPTSLKHIGYGALAGCLQLGKVVFDGKLADQLLVDEVVYSADTTVVVTAFPCVAGELELLPGVERITKYAFLGAMHLTKLTLPQTLTRIETLAMAGCFSLQELHCQTHGAISAAADCLDGVDYTRCTLYVPAGYKDDYMAVEPWMNFGNHVQMEGKAVVARTAMRDYGEKNPTLKCTYINTDKSIGQPELTCDAVPESPVGTYIINVAKGTIEEEVNLIPGELIVSPVTVMATVSNYKRYTGEENPDFQVKLTARWKLDDTAESVMTEMPRAETTATKESPAGKYPITIVGGATTKNYKLTYGPDAVLTVEEASIEAVDALLTADGQTFDVYTLDGRLVMSRATTTRQLRPGIYVVGGRTIVVK